MAEMLSHREGRAYIVTTEGGSLADRTPME